MKKGYIALGALGALAVASIAGVVVAKRVQARRRQKDARAAELNGK